MSSDAPNVGRGPATGQWPLGQTSRRPRHRGRGPERPSPRMPSDMASTPPLPDLVLYSRPGCHLCDETRARRPGPARGPRRARSQRLAASASVDITSDADLERALFDAIPVLELGGDRLRARDLAGADPPLPRRPPRRVHGVSGDNLTILVAFAAGLLSFLSPCVLPLVPAYLGQLTAVAVAGTSRPATRAQPLARAAGHALAYVAGLRGRVHAARRDRDVRGGRPVPVPAALRARSAASSSSCSA